MAKLRKYGARSISERKMEAEQRNEAFKLLSLQQQLELLDRRLGKGVGAEKQRVQIQYKIDHPQIKVQKEAIQNKSDKKIRKARKQAKVNKYVQNLPRTPH
tara:strand:+ start:492 stop:794 length:303 start_codon:yes stop_codon:yes gene_type:complete